jgi:hypothetical protein
MHLPHHPFDAVKAAGEAIAQDVAPDTPILPAP